MRSFTAIDGAHCISAYGGILLIAVSLDANKEKLPLAWTLVATENKNNWCWFMTSFGGAFWSFVIPKAVIISDQHKNLLAAIRQLFPGCSAACCCQHIADNIVIRYDKACRKLFWTCAYAKTKQILTEAVEMLWQHNAPAAAYLKDIDAVTWATVAFPAPRYCYLTFDHVELVNRHWLEARN